MKNLSFLDKFIYLINSFLATLLLLSYFLPYISPKTVPVFAVLAIFVPFLIILNITFTIYWVVKLKKQFFLSTIILIIGFFISLPLFKFSGNTSSLNNDLKVMSYNVKSFDLFNNNKQKINGNDFIISKNPDVLIIQEYYKTKKIKFTFPYQFIKTKPSNTNIGMAIYSKFKIINSGSLDFKDTSNNIIFVDILKEKDTIRIYNIHLQSLRIKPNEENFGEKDSKKLLQRLNKVFKSQATQTEQFLAHEKQWIGKKIICGDFNNTAYSWVYKQISKDKKDAFIEAGKGFNKTYDYWFPMRIDFILTDKTAIINQFTSFQEKYSDHFPIQARINW
jgi:endonuclease/exonuclease/phosphatase family metal-dependent hydrolase